MEEVNMKTILKVKPKHQHSTIFIRFCDVAEANLPMIFFFLKINVYLSFKSCIRLSHLVIVISHCEKCRSHQLIPNTLINSYLYFYFFTISKC